ncbi:MAG: DNA methyltransferase [Desulfobacterales bacterium]
MGRTIKLAKIEREKLFNHFKDKLETAYYLNRQSVSFQANKSEPIYRWFKFKEGFSSTLVKYFLEKYSNKPGRILDPFAGAGTTLFTAQELGWESHGIELLPVASFIMKMRQAVKNINISILNNTKKNLWDILDDIKQPEIHIKHISITKDAFPNETEEYLNKFLTYCSKINNPELSLILRFAAFSVLEGISFTRKDGQYLRWDHRAKRNLKGTSFDKGKIYSFKYALNSKLNQIIEDLSGNRQISLFNNTETKNIKQFPANIIDGSCLEELPKLETNFFDFIITSPPYCNRYDYTRTYALELVYLGYNAEQVRNLRQTMLSSTVENKEKLEYLKSLYSSFNQRNVFNYILNIYNNSNAMSEVNSTLEELNKLGSLNNKNIPRMVKNYFLEMCFVVYEMARVIKKDGYSVMVNDNVRYGGEEIPVDLILSEFAENFGFEVEKIFILPKGKGNSSQQMGNYGRTEIRKCVYLWRKK